MKSEWASLELLRMQTLGVTNYQISMNQCLEEMRITSGNSATLKSLWYFQFLIGLPIKKQLSFPQCYVTYGLERCHTGNFCGRAAVTTSRTTQGSCSENSSTGASPPYLDIISRGKVVTNSTSFTKSASLMRFAIRVTTAAN